ncbi:unnamed protein product [Polarella glacialis]|uniref:Uncharacterized protein n=1 Tax=Polarella glacialis TaxID=89957 RepID=A0A813L9S2_POLGL|nr:unnamed protein product [Polarella glacialis]
MQLDTLIFLCFFFFFKSKINRTFVVFNNNTTTTNNKNNNNHNNNNNNNTHHNTINNNSNIPACTKKAIRWPLFSPKILASLLSLESFGEQQHQQQLHPRGLLRTFFVKKFRLSRL